ncbi:MAG: bifunctional UDP-N-acetylmuramoyl-tripeptide:D-alanyl-D-alanine ligase/alanine racemase [Candidatus Cardinium sp.]|uniref:bifunctional UDP-N-acetylmuramoyl-tripeptide:D-alanyl-D-alanine ligase/alanine racemase n=1 Tax=Cardinium endosymbiont of Dermatophagoides farinae TaxID=2597823 RepID=UPI001183065A|nr:bifunctional UDP-N-acetylmuramoyl-tripeptide:D-alanyl-D-alanine ligase/alanine racemase [Cardinium endosymbiont of Dermatophagoides farinae]TSJ80678.1 bifunctional UDP-N-acetylmuramoyl-tripeptide:D-alanyl-D-alanine ligase/alanine racemase [Cardinium endosymbiont of Dermatophagoides farinae]UWW96670.1 MAG: bifunctional UDP-N-acetylmuramoyl-tripeptide:D-alanyl-D-alanine ligase/alanine racemase [Candidatus Cardinium sp.]
MHHTLAYFKDLVVVTAGQVVAETANLPITELSIDSRNKTLTPFPIFFAIVGINHNGHDYIAAAYHKGIRQFVVNDRYNPSVIATYKDVNMLAVTDTLKALHQFTAFYRSKYRLPLLGITGSNGKTIVKEWMHELLSRKYKTVSNPHSYNSQVGVPLAVSLLQPNHEYGVFEAGISQTGEMEKLAPLIQPTHGLLTNIGPAHSQGFQNLTQKIQEKIKLFTSCSTIYYCKDDPLIHLTLSNLYGQTKVLVSWSSLNSPFWADYLVTCKQLADQTTLQITSSTGSNTFVIPFRDNASIANITHCLVYLLDNGSDPAQLQRSLLQLKSIPMRMTLKTGVHRCQIIDDTYTNDIASLRVALDFMQQQQPTKRTVILSDILQSATADGQLYQELATLLAKHAIHRLVGIGPVISHYSTLFPIPETIFFNSVADFITQKPSFKDETILVKGARTFQLERIVQSIEKNSHGTILEIDMHAIRHNLSYFRRQLNPTTKIMAMVKASTYGSGSSSFELASALQRHGIAYLGVAYMDEGICLRQKGITLPIMVMNPTDDNFDAILSHHLEPEIYSLALLDELSCFIAERNTQPIPIHLKLETGMHRLGIAENELDQLIEQLQQMPSLHIVSIFSHLAASQADVHDGYTHLQVERFIKMARYIEKNMQIKTLKHILNTNGILRFPQFQFDMVRLGIGLHGVGVDATIQPHLLPASKLKTTISQIKSVQKGDSIGYDRKAIATQDMTIATIPIGYADGLSRSFGGGKGRVVIQGRQCPIIGNVCMDMAIVDVTGMALKRGDKVIIFSAAHSIDTLAEQVGTISYELLTQIGQRVKRIYYS